MGHITDRQDRWAAVGMVLTASGLDHWAASPLQAHVEDLCDAAASGSKGALVGNITDHPGRRRGPRCGGWGWT